MNLGFWQRIKNLLIEASIESSGAPDELKHWSIRVEGVTFEITMRDSKGQSHGVIKLTRRAVDQAEIEFPVTVFSSSTDR